MQKGDPSARTGRTPAVVLVATVAALTLAGTAAANAETATARPAKVDPGLMRLIHPPPSGTAGGIEVAGPRVDAEGLVAIDAVASGDPSVLRSDLQKLGMQNAAVAGRIVSGRLPVRSIGALEGLASLAFVRAAGATTRPSTATPGSPPS